MAKIDVERITLERLEGPSQECIKKSHNTWKQAEATISEWALTSPKNGVIIKLTFTLSGKMDLNIVGALLYSISTLSIPRDFPVM